MHGLMKWAVGLFAGAVLVATCASATAQVTRAKVSGGVVEASPADGVTVFKGLPFAAPPVGDLRWREPQPVVPWTGVKRADSFAPECSQDPAHPAGSEDCLYLNVWTAAKTPGARLPVMVWIHGGGLSGGATSMEVYDGSYLAKKGVIFVSIAYRLGVLGFLAHPELSAESGHGSGNYGLEDQIAALKWVRVNIAGFGGDPSNITVSGESAGASSVSLLAASPLARGLFDKAIAESGATFGPGPRSAQDAEAQGTALFKTLGAADLKAARALPMEAIEKAGAAPFGPNNDGHVLLGDQYQLYERHRFNDTPVLIGSNSGEGGPLVPPPVTPESLAARAAKIFGSYADRILSVYPHATDDEALQAMRDIVRDFNFGWQAWAWARLQAANGRHPAYLYYFDRAPSGSAHVHGAPHMAEVPFVFDNPHAADRQLAEQLSTYWVNFVRTGNPNGPGLPRWPAFTAAHPLAMGLGTPSEGPIPVPNMAQLQALDAYFAWKRAGSK